MNVMIFSLWNEWDSNLNEWNENGLEWSTMTHVSFLSKINLKHLKNMNLNAWRSEWPNELWMDLEMDMCDTGLRWIKDLSMN